MNEIEFRTAREALQVAQAAEGVSFAYLCRFGVGDLIMTIPVN